MDDRFKIYVEQLRDGHTETLSESFDPDFLGIDEKELQFPLPVKVEGDVYLAKDELVLHFNIETFCVVPCSICNEPVKEKIKIKGFYFVVPVEEVKSGIYNFKEILREAVLLDVPLRAECHHGKCPQRKEIEKYLKHEEKGETDENGDGYHPFADLNIDDLK